MNFFEHQELARRNTRRLVLMYALAVVAVVAAVDLVIAAAYAWGSAELYAPAGRAAGLLAQLKAVPPVLYAAGAALTATLIFLASLYHVARLREGGEAVARMAGARPVEPGSADLLERRLLNVVEEMAIAAGMRVPRVFVMDEEESINAFAAGYSASNAVIAVTRGALETLNRDELQGVVGHEFSHILNGDMGLNIRMMGVLGGIVFIGAVGEFIMRSVGQGRGRRDSASGGIFLVGLAIFVVGYIGLFFARLIKAAVSRQREFLADASSVQFTRNPDGIAGALDQIDASGLGTAIANRYAEDMSHMYFGQAVTMWFAGLFATHPPIEERVRRIRPRFDRSRYQASRAASAPAEGSAAAQGFAAGGDSTLMVPVGRRKGDAGRTWSHSAGEGAALVGTLDSGKVDFARRLLRSLPDEVHEQIVRPEGASALLVALMLARDAKVLQGQLAATKAAGVATLAEAALAFAPRVHGLGAAFHLPLVDLALPVLKSAPEQTRKDLLVALQTVIHADRRVSLHEFVVLMLVQVQLSPAPPPAVRFRTIGAVREEALGLLSLVCHVGRAAGAQGEEAVLRAFKAGAKEMGLDEGEPKPRAALTLGMASAAFEMLRALAPLQQAVLVRGLFAAVTFDGTIRVAEAEFMRLVGAMLDCPLPPLLEEIDPATLA